MLIATSLMYSNDTYEIEKQYKALQTWRDAGFDIISCNVLSEIKQLPILFPQVRFVELKRSGKERTGKPFPFIFDLLEALRENIVQENEVCGIINSDIFIKKYICCRQTTQLRHKPLNPRRPSVRPTEDYTYERTGNHKRIRGFF